LAKAGALFSYAQKQGGEWWLKVYCDNEDCEYNESQLCVKHEVYYVRRRCRSFRRASTKRAAALMHSAYRSGCRKQGGKHITTDIRRVR